MKVNFNRLDLNLLRVFDAVMEERSVLRASQRVCLSQSAVSHALARLREMLDDELFIRTATGMQPTSRALSMAPLVREAWRSLAAAIEPPIFEPRHSIRRFTIAVNDFVAMAMVPQLLQLLRRNAPLVDLEIRSASQIDLAEQIDLGRIDVAIGIFSQVPSRFRSKLLFTYDDVLIANSSLHLGKLSLEKLLDLPIAVVSLHGECGELANGFVSERGLARRSEMYDRIALERAYSGRNRNPRIAVALPDFLALPSLLEDPHLAAIAPRPFAMSLADVYSLSTYELPYKTTPVEVCALWHERNAGDASQEWLREMLERASEHLRASLVKLGSPARPTSAGTLPRFVVGV